MNYLIWLFIFIWFPTAILWYFHFPLLWRYKKTLFWTIFAATIVSTAWDSWAIPNKVWIFPDIGHLRIYLLGIPLEEYLFFSTVTLLVGSVVLVMKYQNQ